MKTLIASASVLLIAATMAIAGLKTGDPAPDFQLKDIDGKEQSISAYKGKFVILEWVNHGCPFVKKHYESGNMQRLQKELTGRGAVWLTISSSVPGKQGNMTADEWKKSNTEKETAATATLLDTDGKVGKLYGAKTTPHMFVINPEGKLVYQGAIDSIPSVEKADIEKAKNYVRTAFEEANAGKPVTDAETKPYGCSVKY